MSGVGPRAQVQTGMKTWAKAGDAAHAGHDAMQCRMIARISCDAHPRGQR
jgi:hypothetical protein